MHREDTDVRAPTPSIWSKSFLWRGEKVTILISSPLNQQIVQGSGEEHGPKLSHARPLAGDGFAYHLLEKKVQFSRNGSSMAGDTCVP